MWRLRLGPHFLFQPRKRSLALSREKNLQPRYLCQLCPIWNLKPVESKTSQVSWAMQITSDPICLTICLNSKLAAVFCLTGYFMDVQNTSRQACRCSVGSISVCWFQLWRTKLRSGYVHGVRGPFRWPHNPLEATSVLDINNAFGFWRKPDFLQERCYSREEIHMLKLPNFWSRAWR